MTTIFLRFPDADTFFSSLAEGYASNGETITPLPDGVTALSLIGVMSNPAVLDPATGNILTPATLIDGFHVNILGVVPASWQQYVIPTPVTPWRIFGEPA
jgi:hypothetical protein